LPASAHPDLLIGFETSDDAGVFRLSATQALVQTMDFFPPIVDDPYAYGQIAAANALSDVYAMGGTPLTAMNISCFDPEVILPEVWAETMRGGSDKVAEAGAVLVGGHTVVDPQPKYGLAVTGVVDPREMFSNASAEVGDLLLLSKPLGTGIITTAAKSDAADAEELDAALGVMRMLNRSAAESAARAGVRCATDITGFGLVGHLSHVARASNLTIEVEWRRLPLLPGVRRLVEQGYTTAAGERNREFLGARLEWSEDVPEWIRQVVCDPQTSGGLAVFARSEIVGFERIGRAISGPPNVRVV
jgi:selenide,water dikinase